MNRTVPITSRVSPFLLAIILITLFLSMFSIYLGVNEYASDQNTGTFYIGMGAVTLALSAYMLIQTRKRMLKLASVEMQPMSTTLTCQKCGLRNVRDFQRGDFVFKQTDQACSKDNEKMLISAIFREVKEKEKAKQDRLPLS